MDVLLMMLAMQVQFTRALNDWLVGPQSPVNQHTTIISQSMTPDAACHASPVHTSLGTSKMTWVRDSVTGARRQGVTRDDMPWFGFLPKFSIWVGGEPTLGRSGRAGSSGPSSASLSSLSGKEVSAYSSWTEGKCTPICSPRNISMTL